MSTKLLIVSLFLVLASHPSMAAAQPTPLRIRQNYNQLSATQKESFKRGVQVMKSRPANDPRSWQFQANVHGMLTMPTSPLHRQCEHGTDFFLPWHRGYLYYFERILREASGDPTLNLPYWDWPSEARLPYDFRFPANPANPLFEAGRTLNGGGMLNNFFLRQDLNFANSQSNFSSFSSIMEGPHGSVHVMVGGRMGGVPTSANDPIFWLHHANVDRQWDKWLASRPGRQNPNSMAFLNRQFQFADVDGQTRTVRVRDILFSEDLNYRYDDVFGVAETALVMANEGPQEVLATSIPKAESGQAPEKLVFSEKRVQLALEKKGQDAVESIPATQASAIEDQPAEQIKVVIKGIRFKETPAFTYAVFLNLPSDENNEQRMAAHYIGTIDFFTATQNHGDAHEGPRRVETADGFIQFNQELDLTATIAALKESGQWKGATKLDIVIRPLAAIPTKEEEELQENQMVESATQSEMSFEGIEILQR